MSRPPITRTRSVEPQDFSQKEGAVFKLSYLGLATVLDAEGGEPIREAWKEIKAQNYAEVKVFMVVSKDQINVVGRETNVPLQAFPLETVTYCGLNAGDKKTFGLILKTQVAGVYDCCVFSSKDKPADPPKAINKALVELQQVPMANRNRLHSDTTALNKRSMPSPDRWSVSIDAYYLGSQAVTKSTGSEVVKQAVAYNQEFRRRLQATQPKSHAPKKGAIDGDAVTLLFTDESVKIIDRTTGEVVHREFIKNITFSTALEHDKSIETFAFLANDDRLGRTLCHMTHVGIGQAIEAVNAVNKSQRKNDEIYGSLGFNPFAVLSSNREASPPSLFNLQIHRADLQALKPIGAGQYGEVYLALQTLRNKPDPHNKVHRAVKLLRSNASSTDKEQFVKEAETLLALTHENIVSLVGVAIQQAPWLAVLEFLPYGDLRSVLLGCKEKGVVLTLHEQLSFCHQIADACAHIAAKGMVHMDLAARNCLLGANNVVKVSDLGLTNPLIEGKDYFKLTTQQQLPIKWVAIEGLLQNRFSELSDVWAFGVLMWEIFSYGEMPYKAIRSAEIPKRVREGLRLEMPDLCPQEVWLIMAQCWRTNPPERYRFKEMMSMFANLIAQLPPAVIRDVGATVHGSKINEFKLDNPPDRTKNFKRINSIHPNGQPSTPAAASCPVCSTSFVGLIPAQVTSHLEDCRQRSRRATPSTPQTPSSHTTFGINDPSNKCPSCGLSFAGMDYVGIRMHSMHCGQTQTPSRTSLDTSSHNTPQPSNMSGPPAGLQRQPSRKALLCPYCQKSLDGLAKADVAHHISNCDGKMEFDRQVEQQPPSPSRGHSYENVTIGGGPPPLPPHTPAHHTNPQTASTPHQAHSYENVAAPHTNVEHHHHHDHGHHHGHPHNSHPQPHQPPSHPPAQPAPPVPLPSDAPAPKQQAPFPMRSSMREKNGHYDPEKMSFHLDGQEILRFLDLMQYTQMFTPSNIGNDMLTSLNDIILFQYGIEDEAHARSILSEIEARMKQSAQNGNPSESKPRRDSSSSEDEGEEQDHMDEPAEDHRAKEAEMLRQAAIEREKVAAQQELQRHVEEERKRKDAEDAKRREADRARQEEEERAKKDAEKRRAEEAQKASHASPPSSSSSSQNTTSPYEKVDLITVKERAQNLEVSREAEVLMRPKQQSVGMFGGDVAKKSKIWLALNPQPLAHQTARDRMSRVEEVMEIDTVTKSTALNIIHTKATVTPKLPADAPGFPEDEEDGFDEEEEDMLVPHEMKNEIEEEEEEEEEQRPFSVKEILDLDDELSQELNRLRQAREDLHNKHTAELRAKYEAEQRRIKEEMDKELAVINARMEAEKAARDDNKEEFVKEAQERLATELNFGSFTFKF